MNISSCNGDFAMDKVNRLTEEILTQSHFFVDCLSSLAVTDIHLPHPRGGCSSIDGPDEISHAEMIQLSLNSIPNRQKRWLPRVCHVPVQLFPLWLQGIKLGQRTSMKLYSTFI